MEDGDDYDDFFGGIYEDGHWEWNDVTGSLEFESDLSSEQEAPATQVIVTSVEFKDDLDLLEQQRFRKRFQRKISPDDVVLLQDIKDVVLFTVPKAYLTPSLVNAIHLPTTNRFIRALIMYCQYYLQISDEMSRRMLELQTKVRTPKSEEIELQFCANLQDLRLLVAKEYCAIIIGAADFSRYHHMGANRKSRSLSKTESVLFESILRISMQIVWLALGRKLHNQLELEVHRLFKSDIFNIIENKLSVKKRETMDKSEEVVMFGHCLKQGWLTNPRSPLMSEIQCDREIDFRLLGLGVIEYDSLSPRLRFFERALIEPEESLKTVFGGMSIGILGLPRSRFDTMLKEVQIPDAASSRASMRYSMSRTAGSRASRVSACSTKTVQAPSKLYEEIRIPDKEDQTESLPEHFPTRVLSRKSTNEEQRKKWVAYSYRLQAIKTSNSKHTTRVNTPQRKVNIK